MRCLQRNKRQVYLCNQYQDGYIEKYKEPIPIKINYQPKNSDSDLIALGMDFPMYLRIKADLKDGSLFHANDRVYVNVEPGKPFDELCKDADYEVDSEPIATLNVIEITLKKLSGK